MTLQARKLLTYIQGNRKWVSVITLDEIVVSSDPFQLQLSSEIMANKKQKESDGGW